MATLSRRSVLASIAGSSVLMGAKMAFPSFFNLKAASGKPNILYIMTDQQSWNMISCYAGSQYLHTPAVDSIAAHGVRFDKAYATNPLCVPSRISLVTGLMPSKFGVQTNRTTTPSGYSFDGVAMMGKLLTDNGYDARWGGKTHMNLLGANWLTKMGFTELTDEWNYRELLATTAVNFLNNAPAQPFFLGLSFINPHDICYMAENDVLKVTSAQDLAEGRYGSYVYGTDAATDALLDACKKPAGVSYETFIRDMCPPLPANHAVTSAGSESVLPSTPTVSWNAEKWRLFRYAYCRLTELVDSHIGLVLNAFRAHPELENNTVVLFTSDHGDQQGAHMREQKPFPYDEAARVPFIISYKGECAEGRVDDTHLVSNGLDLLPTVCDYAGITVPSVCLGRSLRPLAQANPYTGDWREYVAAEMSLNGGSRMIRTQHYKYFLCRPGNNVTIREMLFDMDDDPGEMTNIAGNSANAAILDYHRALLASWVNAAGDTNFKQYLIPPVNPVSADFNVSRMPHSNAAMHKKHENKQFDVRGRNIGAQKQTAAGAQITNGEKRICPKPGRFGQK